MNAGHIFLFAAFVAFISLTKEVPIKGSTLPPELDERNIGDQDKTNNSTMSTTTLGYEKWWYYPTRRPPLSFKDFPGRPGVATWREITPGSSKENRKTSKPTAAGVSSSSQSFPLKYHYSHIIWVLFFSLCLCWT